MYFVLKTEVLIFKKKKKFLHKLINITYWRDHVYKAEENQKYRYMIYLLWVIVVSCVGRTVRFDLLWSFSEHHHHTEKRKKAKVLFDYEPENEDELKIEVGDTVEIIKQVRKFPQSKSTGSNCSNWFKLAMILKILNIFWKLYNIDCKVQQVYKQMFVEKNEIWRCLQSFTFGACMRKVIVRYFCRKKKDGGRVYWMERPGFSPPTLWRLSVQRTKSLTMICLNLSLVKIVLCENKCALSKDQSNI